jgi:sulfide:quinone oxidoreductase
MRGPPRVVIAGAGVAGLECALALHATAGQRVETTLIDPAPYFALRAMVVAEPFGEGMTLRIPLDVAAADAGAAFVPHAVRDVDLNRRELETDDGELREYDALVLAIGSHAVEAFPSVPCLDPEEPGAVDALVTDVRGGRARSVGVLVPDAPVWPVPAYELALLLARRGAEVVLATAEEAPLGLFGPEASAALRAILEDAGVELLCGEPPRVATGVLVAGGRRVHPERLISLPYLVPRPLNGIADVPRWLHVDGFCRLIGQADAYAAGDATAWPVKQGALAAQQGDTAALHVAYRVGAEPEPQPFEAVLRGRLLTGTAAKAWRRRPHGAGETGAQDHCLWWPPTKVAGKYLSHWLETRFPEGVTPPPPPGAPVELHLGEPAAVPPMPPPEVAEAFPGARRPRGTTLGDW